LRIVVAGAAGFIGSHMCDRLLEEGHSVVGLDNFLTGSPKNIGYLKGSKHFQFLEQDITTPFAIDGPVDCVVNLASPASPQDYLRYPLETLEVGSIGTRRTLDLARDKDARYLLASTSECYGDALIHPQAETYWGNVNPVGPRSCYDESKRFAEALTVGYYRKYALRISIARIFNTYGSRMKLGDGRVILNFFEQAFRGEPITVYGDGMQTRSFCYISDMVDGLYRLLGAEERYPVNLGNPDEMTVLELARQILQLTQSKSKIVYSPLPEDDPKQRLPDIRKARKLLAWEPRISLAEGLKLTMNYYLNEPEQFKKEDQRTRTTR